MRAIALMALFGALLAGGIVAVAQQGDGQSPVRIAHVAGSVHMLIGRGGNIGLSVGDDGVLMIDSQFANLSEPIRAAIDKLKPGGVKFLVNTHVHPDHVGGNVNFGKTASIFAQENVRRRMVEGARGGPFPPHALPTITYKDGLSIHFNGEDVQVDHYAKGHTDGDSVIYFPEANVIHMGDHFFVGRFPFVDLDSGGSVDGYIKNVREILAWLPDGAKIIPGHGPLATEEDLKKFLGGVEETVALVRKKIEAGESLQQAREAGLPEEWAPWGSGFISTDRWIETIYRDAQSEK